MNHHVFGMDGSFDEGYHAGDHSNPLKKVYDLEINGKVIKTSPHLKEVAKTVPHEVSMLKLDSVKFYGEGLVQELMKDAKLDKPKFAIAFQRPVLISEASRRKFERLHLKAEYGTQGFKHAETIKKMVEKCGFKSVLDYGSGKGTLATSLDFPIWEYDPAIKEKSEHPRAADLVVCTDVLECIEEQYLEDVVCHLKSLIKQVGYFTMTGERKKWEELIGKYLHVADVKEIGDKLQFVVGPKRQKVDQPIPAPVMIQPVNIQADLTKVDWKFAA